MRMRSLAVVVWAVAIALGAMGGCTSDEAARTEPVLGSAGFVNVKMGQDGKERAAARVRVLKSASGNVVGFVVELANTTEDDYLAISASNELWRIVNVGMRNDQGQEVMRFLDEKDLTVYKKANPDSIGNWLIVYPGSSVVWVVPVPLAIMGPTGNRAAEIPKGHYTFSLEMDENAFVHKAHDAAIRDPKAYAGVSWKIGEFEGTVDPADLKELVFSRYLRDGGKR